MKKLSLFAALLAGGLLFSGCVYMDHPVPQISEPSELGCLDTCNGYDLGHGWIDYVFGTAGPAGYMSNLEEGEWWGAVSKLGTMQVQTQACPWDSAGSGANKTRVDSYHNYAGGDASGCEPYNTLCGWGGPFWWYGSLCEPPLVGTLTLCNVGNGQCNGPIWPYGYYNAPPDTYFTNLGFMCVDERPTPGSNEFDQNIRRRPNDFCHDCGTAASIQAPEGKVVICHVPPGNPDNAHTIIIGAPAVPAHLAHGDYEGECKDGGGGEGGEGLEMAAGNRLPDWTLGVGFNVDYAHYLLTHKMPFTNDWTSCARNACGSARTAAVDTLAGILASFPTDDSGSAVVGIRKLNGSGESIELNPPLEIHVGMQVLDGGRTAFKYSVNATQTNVVTFVQWVLNNTPDKAAVDFSGISFELSNGTLLHGNTIAKVLPYSIALNHDRLEQGLPRLQQLQSATNRNLDARVAGR
jgi:hypothetical protein